MWVWPPTLAASAGIRVPLRASRDDDEPLSWFAACLARKAAALVNALLLRNRLRFMTLLISMWRRGFYGPRSAVKLELNFKRPAGEFHAPSGFIHRYFDISGKRRQHFRSRGKP